MRWREGGVYRMIDWLLGWLGTVVTGKDVGWYRARGREGVSCWVSVEVDD